MPKALKEISGIQYKDETNIVCVEDNKGIIYFYNPRKEKITDEIIFNGKGDYEDLVTLNEDYYILRSDGFIYKKTAGKNSIEYKIELGATNNPEGMCLDKRNNRILIACKDKGGNDLTFYQKAVYSFSLQNYTLSQNPVLVIDIKNLNLGEEQKHLQKDLENFSPSGIAINPISGHIYIISARGNILLVLEEKGEIIFVKKLPPKVFSQPEGICFSPSGDLIISNEGKDGPGTILRFKPNR
jgi:hypothetical protein